MTIDSDFGLAEIKQEGKTGPFDGSLKKMGKFEEPSVPTTYVERQVPVLLEEDAHKLIDDFLKSNGYNPNDL